MSAGGRARLVLFVSLFLVMLGFGIIIPILPFYVRKFDGDGKTLGALMATFSLVQLLCAPYWGRLSDRIGRRPVLLTGLLGYGLSSIIFGLATHLWMLFAARFLAGLLSSATLPTAQAYIADTTSEKERGKGMGMLGAAIGLGMVTGPGLGGYFGFHDLALPFLIAGGLSLLVVPFAFIYLPESLPAEARVERAEVKRFSLNTLHHPLIALFATAWVASFSMSLFESTFGYFAADRVGYGPRDLGIVFASLGLGGALLQGGLLGRLMLKVGEVKVVLAGLLLLMAAFAYGPFAFSSLGVWVMAAGLTLGSVVLRPSVSTLISRASSEGVGGDMGLMQAFDALGRVIGPVLGGVAYDFFQGYNYFLGAVFLLLILPVLYSRLKPFQRMASTSLQA